MKNIDDYCDEKHRGLYDKTSRIITMKKIENYYVEKKLKISTMKNIEDITMKKIED